MSFDLKTLAEKWDTSGHRKFTPQEIGWLLDEVERLSYNQAMLIDALNKISSQGGDVMEQWSSHVASCAISRLKD